MNNDATQPQESASPEPRKLKLTRELVRKEAPSELPMLPILFM